LDDDVLKKIEDSVKRESQERDDSKEVSVSNVLDAATAPKRKLESEIKLDILESSSNHANKIYEFITQEEDEKKRRRGEFIKFFKHLLVISLLVILALIILDAANFIHIAKEIFICTFLYVIANIFTILFIMTKYINNSQYLDMFKAVTNTMLNYLIEDKKSVSNNRNGEEKSKESKK
jgi:hypothetical protein